MKTGLVAAFLCQECTPDVKQRLLEAIANAALPRQIFEFNRFEVTIARNDETVTLEDVLDPTESGAERVAVSDFAAALNRWSDRSGDEA